MGVTIESFLKEMMLKLNFKRYVGVKKREKALQAEEST